MGKGKEEIPSPSIFVFLPPSISSILSTKKTTDLPVGELVLWCGMFDLEGSMGWACGLCT